MAKHDAKIISSNNKGEYLIETNEKREVVKGDKLHDYVRSGAIRLTNVPTYTCISKVRNARNVIIGYNIRKANKGLKIEHVPSDVVKNKIKEFKVQFDNLTLTSDNRLVDRAKETESNVVTKDERKPQQIDTLKNVAKNQKTDATIVLTRQDVVAMFIAALKIAKSQGISDVRLMISGQMSDTMKNGLYKSVKNYRFTWDAHNGQVIDIVISPDNKNTHIETPIDCRRLFSFAFGDSDKIDLGLTKIKVLLLSGIDWSNTVNADEMFYQLNADKLMIKKSKAEKLTNMYGFCKDLLIEAVNFDDFVVPNLLRTTAMFKGCENLRVEDVRLKGISLSNAKFVGEMFRTREHDLLHNSRVKYELGTSLDRYTSKKKEMAIEAIMKTYGTKFIEFFKYAYKSYIESKLSDSSNLDLDKLDLGSINNYLSNVIIKIAAELFNVARRNKLFKTHDDELTSSIEYIIYIAIAYCLGWTGYNKEGLNQTIDSYILNTDVCNKFVFNSHIKEALERQTPEELSRLAKLGDFNRQLVRQMLDHKHTIKIKQNSGYEFGIPAYNDATIKAIKEIYGIDLEQDQSYTSIVHEEAEDAKRSSNSDSEIVHDPVFDDFLDCLLREFFSNGRHDY